MYSFVEPVLATHFDRNCHFAIPDSFLNIVAREGAPIDVTILWIYLTTNFDCRTV